MWHMVEVGENGGTVDTSETSASRTSPSIQIITTTSPMAPLIEKAPASAPSDDVPPYVALGSVDTEEDQSPGQQITGMGPPQSNKLSASATAWVPKIPARDVLARVAQAHDAMRSGDGFRHQDAPGVITQDDAARHSSSQQHPASAPSLPPWVPSLAHSGATHRVVAHVDSSVRAEPNTSAAASTNALVGYAARLASFMSANISADDDLANVLKQREHMKQEMGNSCYVQTPGKHSAGSLPNSNDFGQEGAESPPNAGGRPARMRQIRVSGLTRKENRRSMQRRTGQIAPEAPGRKQTSPWKAGLHARGYGRKNKWTYRVLYTGSTEDAKFARWIDDGATKNPNGKFSGLYSWDRGCKNEQKQLYAY